MLAFITAHSADLINVVLGTLGVFSIIAKLTPTEADNIFLDKIYAVIHTLGLTK